MCRSRPTHARGALSRPPIQCLSLRQRERAQPTHTRASCSRDGFLSPCTFLRISPIRRCAVSGLLSMVFSFQRFYAWSWAMMRAQAAEAAQRRPGCAVGSGRDGPHGPRVLRGYPALPLGHCRPNTTRVSARARARLLLKARGRMLPTGNPADGQRPTSAVSAICRSDSPKSCQGGIPMNGPTVCHVC